MFCAYSSETFMRLPHYDDAKLMVGSNVVEIGINELGKVIEGNGLEADVGVCLLHKHFDMSEGEILLEFSENGASKLSPVHRSDIHDEVLPYMWKIN